MSNTTVTSPSLEVGMIVAYFQMAFLYQRKKLGVPTWPGVANLPLCELETKTLCPL
jgi:hypothetical protein